MILIVVLLAISLLVHIALAIKIRRDKRLYAGTFRKMAGEIKELQASNGAEAGTRAVAALERARFAIGVAASEMDGSLSEAEFWHATVNDRVEMHVTALAKDFANTLRKEMDDRLREFGNIKPASASVNGATETA